MLLSRIVEEATKRLLDLQLRESIEIAERGLRLYPYQPALHEIRAEAYRLIGEDEHYLEALQDWHRDIPWIAEACFRLSTHLLATGQAMHARSWLDRGLSLVEASAETRKLPYGTVSLARLLHDKLQLEYLMSNGILECAYYCPVLEAYRGLIGKYYFENKIQDYLVSLRANELIDIAPFYRRCLYLHSEKLDGALVNDNLDFVQIRSSFKRYGYTIIDGLLSKPVFDELRHYLLASTIWHNDAQQGRSYVGAYQDTGVGSHLISAVSKVVQKKLNLPSLEQIWAYKNIFGQKALGAHADFSCVNVNIWMTPNRYCRNKRGGLIIYNRRAPKEWEFNRYNANDSEIESFLQGAKSEIINFQENRAVVFDGSLFHASDEVDFEESYEGLRINLTLLYGKR